MDFRVGLGEDRKIVREMGSNDASDRFHGGFKRVSREDLKRTRERVPRVLLMERRRVSVVGWERFHRGFKRGLRRS